MKYQEISQQIYTSLKELGLTDLEANLYAISLSLGPSPISEIAKSLGISRPNVYKVIKELEIHGLAKFSEKNKYSRTFMVESPTVLMEKLKEKKDRLNQLDNSLLSSLPDILAQYHQGATTTKIKIIQGKDLFLKTYKQSLEEEKKEIQFFGSAEDFIGFISDYEEEKWVKNRVNKNINIKVLLLPSERANNFTKTDVQEKRETKILKGAWPFVSSFQLFANKVIVWQPKAPLAVLIEDQFIVEMLKSIFFKLWEVS